tara:strand:+ start:313 stop:885 length:573 start_codon:yes stop_codon:yes gene_type:complete
MRIFSTIFALLIGYSFPPLFANDLGPADFPGDIEEGGPRSYHDAWCRQLKKECRVRFSGRIMTIEGFKGIDRSQLISFRHDFDGGTFRFGKKEIYYYVDYLNSQKNKSTALFLFAHKTAATEFGEALVRWYEQDPRPKPNFRYPNSQGPQDTHGRDGGINPYDSDPITDWTNKKTTTDKKNSITTPLDID